jgi:YD repeat-containing protein
VPNSDIINLHCKDIDCYFYEYAADELIGLSNEQRACAEQMVEANMTAAPLRITNTRNNTQVAQKTIQYHGYGNNLIVPKKEYYTHGDGAEELRIQYHNHDQYGNPVYISKDNTDRVVYLWGYKGQYPVAEIRGADYNPVQTALGGTTPESLSSHASFDQQKINNLRANLPNALVTTYTYKPLVGIASQTDPRGVTTHYDYDSFGRLKEIYIIENNQKKILEAYHYHYANQ